MNPPPPARIALAAITIFAAVIFIWVKFTSTPSLAKLKFALDGENPDLPALLAKLEAVKPTTAEETTELRDLKIAALHRLGRHEQLTGKLNEATVHLRAAVALCDPESQLEKWRLVSFALAYTLSDNNHPDETLAITRAVLERYERVLGSEHPETMRCVLQLAYFSDESDEWITAESCYQRVLTNREQTLGPEHPETVNIVCALANVLTRKGDFSRAEALANRALDTCEQTLSERYNETLQSLWFVITNLDGSGDKAKTGTLYRRLYNIRLRMLGPNHPTTCMEAFNLALVYENQKDFAKALPLAEQALEGYTKARGVGHEDTIAAKKLVDELKQKQ